MLTLNIVKIFAPLPLLFYMRVHDYFDLNHEQWIHMLFIANVKEQYRATLASIVHVDGSARVQTVKKGNE